MSEIVIIARLRARPGRGPDLLSLLSELAPRVLRTEPDTLRYAFLVEPDSDPLQITVVEKYLSRAALDAHNSGVLTEYMPPLLDLLDGAPDTFELEPAELVISLDQPDIARLSI